MTANIPYPRIGRRQSISNPVIAPITQGDFVKVIQYIWNKFSFNNGINLSPFRHNLRDYYDEGVAITPYELQTIRGLLSDPELQLCVSPVDNSFRWDNRNTAVERKCIFIDEAFFFLFSLPQTDGQKAALRLIFMGTLLHCLGDYITAWIQPTVDFSTKQSVQRFEGGTKTEYAFFGGIMGGQMADGIHYDYAKIRLFNPMNQPESWFVGDRVAREYYKCDQILKVTVVDLKKNSTPTVPTNTIRQLDICCGWHRSVWKPIHRPPPEQQQQQQQHQQQQQQQQTGFNTQGYFGLPQPTGSQWYPPQPQPHQGGYVSYGAAPGTTYEQPPGFPPPPGNVATGYAQIPPPLSNQQLSWPADGSFPQDPSISWGQPGQSSQQMQEDSMRRQSGMQG